MSPEPIPCQTILARAVDPESLRRSVPITVRKSAFIPRANGLDNDGLSVTLASGNTLERLRTSLRAPDKEGVTLHVGRIRQMSASGHRLDVKADPISGDAYHALITGFPARGPNETLENKVVWNRLAELLASHARCCLRA